MKTPVEKIIHYDKETKQLVLQNHKDKKIRVFTVEVIKKRKLAY